MKYNNKIEIKALVIDSNIIISALIKDNITRYIILKSGITFFAPDYLLYEVEKYKSMVISKSSLELKEFDILFSILTSKVKIISEQKYAEALNKANFLIGHRDIYDVAYLALAISINTPLWSNDKDFLEQDLINIYTTKQLINLLLN